MILTKIFILLFCELFLFSDLISAQFNQTTTAFSLPPQCYAYTTINDESRNVNAAGSTNCDTSFMSGSDWIRFTGNGGTKLPTSPTSPDRCGAQSTGWYSGPMPTTSQTINNGRVCFSWVDNTCKWSNTISVTNCGSFYIYQLTMPPVCAARYCTDTPDFPTTTTTTTTTTTPTTSTMLILSPQCYNHTTIDDPTRNVNQSSTSTCDQNVFNSIPRWVRFTGTGGTQIPTSAVGVNRCGTHATGWYSGEMPSALDTTANGTVCYTWSSNNCNWKNDIMVTNCGSYYVYRLIAPPQCSLRYCTDTPSIPITTTTIATTETTTTTTAISYSQCYDYTIIDDETRNTEKVAGISSCDQNVFNSGPRWIRFTGTSGTQIPTSSVGIDRCGANAPGWYSGEMPSVLYATVNGTVCYTWNSNNCNWKNDIMVTNCGSYYVYQLTAPPTCNLRYCTTNTQGVKMIRKSTTTLTKISNYVRSLFKKLIP